LDFDKDGLITYRDWVKVVVEEGNPYLARIKCIQLFIIIPFRIYQTPKIE
jgi:hypothetical protein